MMKILVVDDKTNVQTSLRIGLCREGYEVDVAGDALNAMTKIQENSYDVLLSDVKMPVVNGFTLASKVAESYPHIRIVLMSAYDFKDYEEKYPETYSYTKLSKPFEMEQLLEVLNNGVECDRLPEA